MSTRKIYAKFMSLVLTILLRMWTNQIVLMNDETQHILWKEKAIDIDVFFDDLKDWVNEED